MKITIDLPSDLVCRLRLRAKRDGKELKGLVAELLERGLSGRPVAEKLIVPVIVKDKKSGLPVIRCRWLLRQRTVETGGDFNKGR